MPRAGAIPSVIALRSEVRARSASIPRSEALLTTSAMALAGGLLVLGLAGCLSDGGDEGATTGAAAPASAPVGPVPYAYIQAVFAAPTAGAALPRSSGCGTVMSNAGAGLTVAAGVVSFLPVIGPVLGAIDNAGGSVLTLFGANAGNACVQSQINALSAQLNSQQAQINQIDQELGLVYTAFYQQSAKVANDMAGISTYGMTQLFTNVQGAYSTTLYGLGLWPNGQAGGSLNTLGTWSSGAQSPVGTTNMSNARAALGQVTGSYPQDLAASYVAPGCPTASYPDPATGTTYPTYACYNNVSATFPQGWATPAVVKTYQTYAQDLAAAIASTQAQSPAGNIVPLFDQYNTAIVSIFQQSVYALQLMYQMEYLANQANYWWSYNNFTTGQGNPNFNATSVIAVQLTLPSATGVTGVQYQFAGGAAYNAQNETLAYNSAQQQLTLLYAAYMNQIYLTTLGYLYTDPLAQGQTWPAAAAVTIDNQSYALAIDYASAVGASVGAYLPKAPYPYQNVPSWVTAKGNPSATPPVAAQAWTQNAVLYQFAGLQNVNACLSNLAAYLGQNGAQGSVAALTQANPGWCPTVYPAAAGSVVGGSACGPITGSGASPTSAFVAGSYYDGSTVIPWQTNPGTGVLSLAGGYGSASKCSVATSTGGSPTTVTVTVSAVPQGMVGNIRFCDSFAAPGNAGPYPGTVPSWSWYAPSGSYTGNPAGLVAGKQYLNCSVWTQAPASSSFSDFFANVSASAWLNIGSTENILNGGSSDGACYVNGPLGGCGSIVYNFPSSYMVNIMNSQFAGQGAYNRIDGYGFEFVCEPHASCPIRQPAMSFQHFWSSPAVPIPAAAGGGTAYPATLNLAFVVTIGGSGSNQYQQFNIVPAPQYTSATPFGSNIVSCSSVPNTGPWNATLNCYFVDGTGWSYAIQRNAGSSGSQLNGIATWSANSLN